MVKGRPAGRGWLDAARHPTRRDGVVAWVLLVLPWAMVLILLHRHQHLGADVLGVLAAASIGLPTLWLTWAAYRSSRRPAALTEGLSLAQVADQLATVVDKQWLAEDAVRRLNDPWPLPVAWTAADPLLTDSWDSLVRLATSGAGWPSPSRPWAAGPEELAGKDRELAEVLERVPTGRLVVLGEPGAGKTLLMVRLVLDLLLGREEGSPVPFLASIASWDPADQDLHGWLAARLLLDHPALAGPPPPGEAGATQAEALLAAGLILPVLDGLDEMPALVRGLAVSHINDALRPGGRVVVTCRTGDYQDAVRPPGGVEVTLRAAAAVQLRPLDVEAVRQYLTRPAAQGRWAPVLAVLGTRAPAGQALRTPLMVGLARAIYDPDPGKLPDDLRDPAELCDPDLTKAMVESLLFDAFIPAAYRPSTDSRRTTQRSRRTAQKAEKTLVSLARHLEHEVGTPDLAWWQLPRTPRIKLVVGLWLGLVFGLAAGLAVGPRVGLEFGLACGLGSSFATATVLGDLREPATGMRVSRHALGVGIRVAFGVGLVAALGVGLKAGLVFGLEFGLLVGLLVGLVYGAVFGLESVSGDLTAVTSPWAALTRDRQTTLILSLRSGLMIGFVVGLVAGLQAGLAFGLGAGLVATFGSGWGSAFVAGIVIGLEFGFVGGFGAGLLAGLGVGLPAAMNRTAWPAYILIKGNLALRRRLPWSLMNFLADAHQRGVLRQVGAVYQFRHLDLQRRLASRG